MIRRHVAVFRLTLMAADAALALLVLAGAAFLRFGHPEGAENAFSAAISDPRAAAIFFAAAWVAVLWLNGLYRVRARWTVRRELRDVLVATLWFTVLILSLLYLAKLSDVSRLFLLYAFPALGIAAFGVRIALRIVTHVLHERGLGVRYILILGANARAKAFADLVAGHPELGLAVVGHLKADPTDNGVPLTRPILGMLDDLETILHSQVVDEVAICLPFAKEDLIEQAARLCEQEGRVVRIPVAPVERTLSLGRLENVAGVGVYSLVNGPDRAIGLLAKRALDIVGSTILIVVTSPILALLALLVRLDSPGQILFRQERVGLHGRSFRVVKFRSMCTDAEQQLDDLKDRNVIDGCAFKLEDDPRITRAGRFLRRSSLDELPQLWNVLHGEMSLVGPRPPLPSEVAEYDVWHRRRLSMKPGMTGLWQVGARRESKFDRWVEKDLEYIDNWSIWLDLKIIARTLPAMLAGSGR